MMKGEENVTEAILGSDEDEDEIIVPSQIILPEAKTVPKKTFWSTKGLVERIKPMFSSSSSKSSQSSTPRNATEAPTDLIKENSPKIQDRTSGEKKTDDGSTFFDSLTKEWVRIDNFAFGETDHPNFFDGTQPLAQDPNAKACHDTIDDDELEKEFMEIAARQSITSQQPKIIDSPRSEAQSEHAIPSKPLRRLSNEMGPELLPSLSNMGTPRKDLNETQAEIESAPRYLKKKQTQSCSAIAKKAQQHTFKPVKPAKLQLVQRKSKSTSHLNRIHLGRINSRSEGSLSQLSEFVQLAGHKKDYQHVQSKVKSYIDRYGQSYERTEKPGRPLGEFGKSKSLSNLSKDLSVPKTMSLKKVSGFGSHQGQLNRMRSFFDENSVTLVKNGQHGSVSARSSDRLDKTRIMRLLDNLSGSDEDAVDGDDDGREETFEVEDVLALVMEERREKKEAEKVLSQLQANYDELQRKFAEAENKIDKLRFGKPQSPFSDRFDQSTTLTSSVDVSGPLFNNTSVLLLNPEPRQRSVLGKVQVKSKHQILQDLEEQLFALDLQSDMNEADRRRKLDKLKQSFNQLLQNATIDSNDSHQLALGRDDLVGLDPDFASLLKSVGQKLTEMDLNESKAAAAGVDSRCDSVRSVSRIKCVNDKPIDPIEKVSKWQAQSKDSTTSTLNHHGASSCYGSLPTSPSPPSIADKTATTVASASGTGQPLSPPAEFDSGYPGSDRSIKFYSLKGISPALSAKSGDHQKSLSQRFLFNLQEEEKSPSAKENCDLTKSVRETPTVKYPDSDSSSSSLPSDFQPLASSEKKSDVVHVENQSKSKPSLLKPPNLHRTYLHTVTDLSSDERSMFEEKESLERSRSERLRTTRAKSEPSGSALSTGRQPLVLAQQIDKEISELRNFYEDHREEMIHLLNEAGEKTRSVSSPNSSPAKRVVKKETRQFSLDSGTDLNDLERERKWEFEKRRRSKKKSLLKSNPSLSQTDETDHMARQIWPNFAVGLNNPSSAMRSPTIDLPSPVLPPPPDMVGISKFFPHLDPSAVADIDSGREVLADGGRIFVPRLNLQELCTDEERSRDPRSFDFNQSTCPSIQENPIDFHNQQGHQGYWWSESQEEILSNTQHGFRSAPAAARNRSQSWGEMRCKHEPLIIVQSCCRHSQDALEPASNQNDSMASAKSKVLATKTTQARLATKRSLKDKRKKSKAKAEMKALLSALEQANQIASALRDRSQDIVHILGEEMKETACASKAGPGSVGT